MSESDTPEAFQAVARRLRVAGCVFAEDEARLLISTADTSTDLDLMIERRVAGQPLEHVLGWVEFYGLRIAVDPGVFVPRRRTEFLVRRAAELAWPSAAVVDLCCGCGAVSTALAAAVEGLELYASDIELAAVHCARRNLGDRGEVYAGDLFQPLPLALMGRVDVLVVNAPYVPTDAIDMMPPEARLYEPRVALDGGPDGLDIARRICAEAPDWLVTGGQLLIETSSHQAPELAQIFSRSGLTARVETDEDLYATIVTGTKPGAGMRPPA